MTAEWVKGGGALNDMSVETRLSPSSSRSQSTLASRWAQARAQIASAALRACG